MKYARYNPKEIEPAMLELWKKKKILENIRKRNSTGQKYYFLEGPPYTSGRIHLGHAWNMALKDMFVRYKRMNGFNVWDRMGYDMHGLPTEHATEKKLKIKGAAEIKEFGVAKFVKECEKLCIENMKLMNQDFIRLGSTLDFSNPYQSITNDFIDGEWWLIKKAHEKGRLYEGLRTMHWDVASSTGVAKHELEYKSVTDTSVYVKLRLREEGDTFLIVWTTTPWTLPFNLAVMVNPEIDYVKCSVGSETWIVAKARSDAVIKDATEQDYKIIEELKGSELEGKKYIHPFENDVPFFTEIKDNPKLHSVVLTKEYVDDSSGTGLVHTAPGCGPEDYEVGHENGLPPFNAVNEKGIFENCGPFTTLRAKKDDARFIELFESRGSIIAKTAYTHDYPHDWRSHEPVIFRATKQWFFKVEDLKSTMIEANNNVKWHPESGYNAFNSWLENLRDNSISKQRFWGTPLPIWRNVDDDKDYIVVGSLKELEELSGKKVSNPHKPWIDDVEIKKNGKTYKRVPDVLDVWVDAGTTSWNCLFYPNNKEFFDDYFPAEFILEGKDQIRGWFNLLMITSFLALDKPSFKSVYMHGFVTDVDGVKMSKSIGNVISPDEVIGKYSADVLRYYSIRTSAGEDMNFSWDDIALKHRQLNVLWNIHKFLITITNETKTNPFEFDNSMMTQLFDIPERFMFSNLHQTVKKVTELFETKHLDEIIKPVEDLFLSLSRTYIKLVRDKSSVGTDDEKKVVAYTIAHVLLETLKLFCPIAPFITDAMYQNLKEHYNLEKESIHEYMWPKANDSYINEPLEKEMEIAQDTISTTLHAREQIKLSVRWPIKELVVSSDDRNVKLAIDHFQDIIKGQVNVKELQVVTNLDGVEEKVRVDFEKIAPRYGKVTPKIVAKLAMESNETLLTHISEDGAYKFTIDEVDIAITREDLLIDRTVPEPYKAVDTKFGVVYVNQKRTPELEAEGYSREIMRRVQAMRKQAGLEKPDRISLYLKTSQELRGLLQEFSDAIKLKVGAEKLKIDILDPVRKHEVVSQEKVKAEEFMIYFDKL